MSRQFRVAVIGAGIGAAHVKAYRDNAELYCVAVVCDLNSARATKVAATVDAAVADLLRRLCLERDDIDVIDICLPPSLHLQAVERALQSGRHVVCEKPLVGSLRDVEQIERLAASAARSVVPVYQYRYGNGLARLRHAARRWDGWQAAGRQYRDALESLERITTLCHGVAVRRPSWVGRSSGMRSTPMIC